MGTRLDSVKLSTIFYISYIMMLFGWMFEKVIFINKFLPYIRILSYLLLIVIVLYNYKKFSFKKICINIVLTIFVIISTIQSGSNTILTLWLFILACEKVNFNKLVKVDMISKCIFMAIIIILFLLGLTEQTQFYTYSGEPRNSLGFGNPNTFGYYVFSICADFVYLKSKKFNMFHLISLIIIAILVSNISLSRTSSLLIIILGIMTLFSYKINRFILSNIFKKILLSLFIVFSILSIHVAKNYDATNNYYNKINEILSGRVSISQKYIKNYDIKIYGQKIGIKNWDKTHTLYLDNAYLKLLINYGLFVYLLIMYIYIKIIKKSSEEKKCSLIMLILIYLIYGITENVMFWLTGNVFLLYIFSDKNKNFTETTNKKLIK